VACADDIAVACDAFWRGRYAARRGVIIKVENFGRPDARQTNING